MPNEQSLTLPAFVIEKTDARSLSNNLQLVFVASLAIAIAAQIAVPLAFSPVPMTLQPLAILLVGAVLGSSRGAAAAALYLAEGAMGFPVFAQGHGGIGWLIAGPTAGYLLAFPLAAWIVGRMSERGWTRSIATTILTMVLGIGTIHLGGWSWLASVMNLGAERAFLAGTVPFLASDAIKIVIAMLMLPTAQRLIDVRNQKSETGS